jgi:hypothetical protein
MPPKTRFAYINRDRRGTLDYITNIELKKPDSIQNLASEEGDEKLKITFFYFNVLCDSTIFPYNRQLPRNSLE